MLQRHPILAGCFLSTEWDLHVAAEGTRSGAFPYYPSWPYDELLIASGSIIVYAGDAPNEVHDFGCWEFVDMDGEFQIFQSIDSRKMLRKRATFEFENDRLWVDSYYTDWDTTRGKLIPLSLCSAFEGLLLRLGPSFPRGSQTYSPMEDFRYHMRVRHLTRIQENR